MANVELRKARATVKLFRNKVGGAAKKPFAICEQEDRFICDH